MVLVVVSAGGGLVGAGRRLAGPVQSSAKQA